MPLAVLPLIMQHRNITIINRMNLPPKPGCKLVFNYCILVTAILLYLTFTNILNESDTMIIKLEQDLTKQDIEILIRYAKMNQDVERLTSLIQSVNKQLKCDLDGSEKLVKASDIYYIESVDKRTFVYCERAVYRTEFRLYQLLEELKKLGFVQISKSCILNISILDTIKPLMNSRMEATLKNGERLFVTRKYLTNIKNELQKGVQI